MSEWEDFIEPEDRDEGDPIEDLDPHRTVTDLIDGVPHCYLGHPECYDRHETARLADEADLKEETSEPIARGSARPRRAREAG